VNSKAEILFKVKFQTAFSYRIVTFLKKLQTKEMWEIKENFISKNEFQILSLQSKVMDKIQRGIGRDILVLLFSNIIFAIYS